jgi:putative methionine-R-sulfoxide reductase with GAF domain
MSTGHGPSRPYETLASRVRDRNLSAEPREVAMQAVVDVLWDGLHDRGVSWVGFYTIGADGESLDLGPHRDKPACTPIGLNGVCGQAYRAVAAKIVDDVRTLGDAYIACDPRDLSEVVVPVLDGEGGVWAVLDLDSFEPGAFSPRDVHGLTQVLAAAFGDTAVRNRDS